MMITRDGDWAKMFNRRAVILGGIQGVLISTLIGRMYYLQVIEADRYRMLAEGNRINVQLLAPPRGKILDRFGHALALNRQQFRVLVIPEQTRKVSETLSALSQLIALNDYEIERIKKEAGRHRGFVPITVKENLPWDEMAAIQVNAPDLPGVVIDEGLTRYYPQGEQSAHLIGYVAPVAESDLNGDPLLQLPGFHIGRSGVERMEDTRLRGKGGTSQVEVNAYGRVIRELERHEGQPGGDVVLTIDERIQSFAANVIDTRLPVEEQSASINVMDIYTGEVLAMTSSPGFDPHIFSRAPSPAEWKALSTDARSPLTNKAIAGRYPPGSTFKVCVALAALEHGVVTAEQRVSCPGHYTFGSRTWYCWKKGGHGSLDIVNAIAQSCDVFFYEMARRLGVDRIAATAHELNLGLLTGIGLMGEQKGLVPTEAWKRTVRGEKWHQGETLNVGIGQGQVNVTPIQLLTFVSRVANGGLAVKPTLLRASSPVTENADGIPSVARNLQSLGISPQDAALVQRGMLGAVSGGGTAGRAQLRMTDPDKADWKMAGKTGTAQTYALSRAERAQGERKQDGLAWKLRDHALFIGFAPFHAPRYAASCIVEHGKSGVNAAMLVRDVMEEVLRLDPSRKPRVDEVANVPPAPGEKGSPS